MVHTYNLRERKKCVLAACAGYDEPPPRRRRLVEAVAPRFLNMNSLMDVRVKAGQPINFEVPFEGEPQPVVTWKQDDGTLRSEDRREIVVRENCTELHIFCSIRGDTGVYSLHLQNEYDVAKASCNIMVLDVPGPPEGPLKISGIHKEGCTLDWKPPLDDGGSDILHYIVEKMDTSRGTWAEVGQFPDCHAKVTGLVHMKEFKFRVKAVNFQGISNPLTIENVPTPPVGPLEITDVARESATLSWKPPKDDGGSPVTNYVVEKRDTKSIIWITVLTKLLKQFRYWYNHRGPAVARRTQL